MANATFSTVEVCPNSTAQKFQYTSIHFTLVKVRVSVPILPHWQDLYFLKCNDPYFHVEYARLLKFSNENTILTKLKSIFHEANLFYGCLFPRIFSDMMTQQLRFDIPKLSERSIRPVKKLRSYRKLSCLALVWLNLFKGRTYESLNKQNKTYIPSR